MNVVVVVAALALAVVAAVGVVRPFGRAGTGVLEPVDPLEEERAGLLSALRDLEAERASGLLPDEDYRAFRSETERRAVAVLRALEVRHGAGELAGGLRELRPERSPDGTARSRRWLSATLAAVVLAAVVASLLAGAVRSRSSDQPITGTQPQTPLAFFQQRVHDHPGDVAARLDLADAYLQTGNVEGAIGQYLAALKLDPQNPEARSTLGFLLYKAGKAKDGLTQVQDALKVSPNDPESLYFEGVILLDGLHQPARAAEAFRAYLAAAGPFGERRAEVQTLLAQAESAQRTG